MRPNQFYTKKRTQGSLCLIYSKQPQVELIAEMNVQKLDPSFGRPPPFSNSLWGSDWPQLAKFRPQQMTRVRLANRNGIGRLKPGAGASSPRITPISHPLLIKKLWRNQGSSNEMDLHLINGCLGVDWHYSELQAKYMFGSSFKVDGNFFIYFLPKWWIC